MKRRQARENAFIALFEVSFGTSTDEVIELSRSENSEFRVDEFGQDLLKMYEIHAEEIDKQIESKLKGWNVDRLPKVSLAVLRLAVTEMEYGEADMESVVINEAVELTKKYAGPDDYQFVNGVLGSLAREGEQQEEVIVADNPATGE